MALMKMPTYVGGGGETNDSFIVGFFYSVNGNSYLLYEGQEYHATGSGSYVMEIPNVLYCIYVGSNNWKFTNNTGKTMYLYDHCIRTQITTGTQTRVPYSATAETAVFVIEN